MASRLAFVQAFPELGIVPLLIGRDEWFLVADEGFHALLLAVGVPGSRLVAPDAAVPGRTHVVCTDADEAPVLARLEERGARALGLFHDLLPKQLAHAPPDFEAERAAPPAIAYAIATIPRTGSTILAEELRQLGVGAPAEHVRPPLIACARRRAITRFDARRWWRDLTRAQSVGGVFGTKIIWDFLAVYRKVLTDDEDAWLHEQLGGLAFFHLVRGDKVEQAVSEYVAHTTGIWHKREGTRDEYELKVAQFGEVDLAALAKTYDSMRAREECLRGWLARTGFAVTELSFDDVCRDPLGEAVRVAQSLGCSVRPEGVPRAPLMERTTSPLHEEIADRLRRHLRSGSARASA